MRQYPPAGYIQDLPRASPGAGSGGPGPGDFYAYLILRSRLPCTDPKSGLRPEMGKKQPKNGFWPHRKQRGKMAEKWENWPKNGSKNGSKMAIFPFFGDFLPFAGGAKNPFFRPFFPISGRRPDLGSVLGNRDCQPN